MASYAQLQKQIEELQKQAKAAMEAEKAEVLAKIRHAVEFYSLTEQEVFGVVGKRGARKKAAPTKQPGVPKYRDPKTGKTWTGHGKPPGWIASARDRTRFLIEQPAASAAPAAPAPASPAAAEPKTRAKRGAKATPAKAVKPAKPVKTAKAVKSAGAPKKVATKKAAAAPAKAKKAPKALSKPAAKKRIAVKPPVVEASKPAAVEQGQLPLGAPDASPTPAAT